MLTLQQQPPPMRTEDGRPILRMIGGYAVQWSTYMSFGLNAEIHGKRFCFLPGAFDRSIASGRDVALTVDLDGVPRARTSDGTLRLESDETGLLASAVLVDTPENRELSRLLGNNRCRGWSHSWGYVFGGWRIRKEGGVEFWDHQHAVLKEITLVIRKVPRLKSRTTPVFLINEKGTHV